MPYLAQAAKQGFQDFGGKGVAHGRELLTSGDLRMETRSGAAQVEGGVHDMHSFEKKVPGSGTGEGPRERDPLRRSGKEDEGGGGPPRVGEPLPAR